ncbi:MAG: type III-B CRISPR module RAMP protein Cmr6 [Canidatus Methanoxibalbensis ujae]|nr:type III-B CRISPR module RAMP protein Cmr6 [Candidatus Methanoxibalbensis ujae]
MRIFILPKDLSLNAYALIDNQVLRGVPMNLYLVFDKYVNKFVTGYFKDGNWIEGKQSDIKRQVYLLKEERARSFKNLRDLRDRKGRIKVAIREGKRTVQKYLYEVIDEILERCDAEEASEIIRNVQDKDVKKEIEKSLKNFLHADLRLSANLVDMKLYQSLHNRMKIIQADLKMQGYSVEEIALGLNWRLAINLGAASVYETSLLFHRNYSIPYIPGSAVKGVTRHWAILKIFEEAKCENWEEISCVERILENASEKDVELPLEKFQERYMVKEDKKKIRPSEKLHHFFKQNCNKIEEIQKIFGTQGKKGEVIFFDALPIIDQERDFIVLDVMNVHYRPYYGASERELKENKDRAPGDWHSPVPVFFLAVENGTKFRFVLASRDENSVGKAKELLKEASENIGIGAKTSSGYGYFDLRCDL